MKLTELEPELFRYEERIETWNTANGPKTGPRCYRVPVTTFAESHCVWFWCPKCHSGQPHPIEVTIAGRGVPDHLGTHNKKGEPTRWNLSGDSFENLSLTPSVQLEAGCNWHGHVTNGDAT